MKAHPATPYASHGHVLTLEHTDRDGARALCQCGWSTKRILPSLVRRQIARHRQAAFWLRPAYR